MSICKLIDTFSKILISNNSLVLCNLDTLKPFINNNVETFQGMYNQVKKTDSDIRFMTTKIVDHWSDDEKYLKKIGVEFVDWQFARIPEDKRDDYIQTTKDIKYGGSTSIYFNHDYPYYNKQQIIGSVMSCANLIYDGNDKKNKYIKRDEDLYNYDDIIYIDDEVRELTDNNIKQYKICEDIGDYKSKLDDFIEELNFIDNQIIVLNKERLILEERRNELKQKIELEKKVELSENQSKL